MSKLFALHVCGNPATIFGTDLAGSRLLPSDLSPEDYIGLGLEPLYDAQALYLLGTRLNAPLIKALWLKLKQRQGRRILLASPTAGQLTKAASVDEIFYRMSYVSMVPPSCGGWHEMNEADFKTYELITEIYQTRGHCSDKIFEMVCEHPLWPTLSFVATMDVGAAALFITEMTDPRWHINPNYPDSHAKLLANFNLQKRRGVSPVRLVRAILDGKVGSLSEEEQVKTGLLQIVLHTWCGDNLEQIPLEIESPRHYFRCMAADVTGNSNLAKGLVTATQRFLIFARDTWLDALAPHRELFVPEHFFADDPSTCAAWREHASTPRKTHFDSGRGTS